MRGCPPNTQPRQPALDEKRGVSPEEYAALTELGTDSWQPGGFHDRALLSVFALFPDSEEVLSEVVAHVNSSEAPHELLCHSHWMLENGVGEFDSDAFIQYSRMSSERIRSAAIQQLHPTDFSKLLDEGMPAEYAAEATCLV